MKVTIVTACYNAESTIADTLQSVAMQTCGDLEHIVIDGASTDRTLDVVKQHALRTAYVRSEPDRGIYDAMNKGLALASGDVIGFLNADDVYADREVLSRVMTVMEREGLDALLGDVEFYRPENPARTLRRYRSARFRQQLLCSSFCKNLN